ncbi:MAG: hypothetical protein J6Y24_03880 [Bacteroidales bacterium]|nr:hypothetical protein [Bacteroidales bacterium]MDD6001235.1 hypothetical protein [Bacteroidales bacterium]
MGTNLIARPTLQGSRIAHQSETSNAESPRICTRIALCVIYIIRRHHRCFVID